MTSTRLHTFNLLGISFVMSAIAAGVGLHIGTMYTDAAVLKALNDDLPAAMAKAQAKADDERLAAEIPENLSPWALAEDSMPAGRHIYGKLDAEFSLVEFSDLECGYCQRLHSTPKALVEQAGGKVNWEWQHYPLGFHNPTAEKAAMAAECVAEQAGNKAFWAFTGQWFDKSQLNGQGVEDITKIALSVGAERSAFRQCLDSGRFRQLVQDQVKKGTELGVTGTPATFVIDNQTGNRLLVKGAQPPQAYLQAMKELIDMRLAPTAQEGANGQG